MNMLDYDELLLYLFCGSDVIIVFKQFWIILVLQSNILDGVDIDKLFASQNQVRGAINTKNFF